jgi:sulfane dehydrogenase subunit SoxC
MRRSPTLPRRAVLQGGLALAGTGAAAAADPPGPLAIPEWTREQGDSVVAEPYGRPSPYERGVVRHPRRSAVFATTLSNNTPLQHLHGIITPNGLHFIRDHAGTPDIDPAQHRLLVHGMVARPLIFTMDDLLRFPAVSRLHFIECAGNTPFWRDGAIQAKWTAQDTHGLLSCAEWTGVRLADVLAEVGVAPGATWLLAEGADAAALARSVPLAKALDDAILAYAQNGERLRAEQGYPLRLLLPGYEGNTNIKWLRRIKLGDAPWETREETSRYTSLLPDGTARQFGFIMEVKSVITHPSGGEALTAGFCEIRGLAWSGRGRIRRVEVSADGGATWREAALQAPVLEKCLTRFRLPWQWQGEALVLQSRATDETGAIQPTRAALVAERGAHADYHYNAIHAWRIAADGKVSVAL